MAKIIFNALVLINTGRLTNLELRINKGKLKLWMLVKMPVVLQKGLGYIIVLERIILMKPNDKILNSFRKDRINKELLINQ